MWHFLFVCHDVSLSLCFHHFIRALFSYGFCFPPALALIVPDQNKMLLQESWELPLLSPLLLLLFFSIRRCRFSSRRLASSTSWCCRHLWKFSTTTPTNMLRTKKLTMRRKEMKYSSIQGLLLITGCGGEIMLWFRVKNNAGKRCRVVTVCDVTCWSTATASRPWYMMLTQPSLEASTNRDIRAWKTAGGRQGGEL